MAELLRVENLKKYFKNPAGMLHAVDGVSFSINAGDTLGVVGESGCGKSTLGRVVIKLLEHTSGTIIFKGKDVTSVTKREERAAERCKSSFRSVSLIRGFVFSTSVDP